MIKFCVLAAETPPEGRFKNFGLCVFWTQSTAVLIVLFSYIQ